MKVKDLWPNVQVKQASAYMLYSKLGKTNIGVDASIAKSEINWPSNTGQVDFIFFFSFFQDGMKHCKGL